MEWAISYGKNKNKITNAKVLIVGMGGLGCPLLTYLASSVQFVHFEFSDSQIEKFKDLSNEVIIGIDHDMYAHTSKLTDANKKALALDFS